MCWTGETDPVRPERTGGVASGREETKTCLRARGGEGVHRETRTFRPEGWGRDADGDGA